MERFYFDHNATTPVLPEVIEAMVSCLGQQYGNASSIHHFGQEAKRRLETARRQVAALLGCDAAELVFTSGGTEGDNIAVLGTLRACQQPVRHMVTSTFEHPAVLAAARQLEREGVEVTYVPVSPAGMVDPDEVRRALRPDTVLISIMHANNELGTVQPIAEIAAVAREAGVLMHSDGVQAWGKIPVDVKALGVDLYTVTGHKIYAPKGAGALYARKGTRFETLTYGGHHERDRRPGTENVPGAAALGAAAEIAGAALSSECARLCALRDRLERSVLDRIPGTGVNGGGAPRTPNTSNIRFEGVEGEPLLISLDLHGFAVSSGAACSSGAVEPSHVLTAIGLPADRARSSLRFSLGRSNDAAQVDALVDALEASVTRLRAIAPQ